MMKKLAVAVFALSLTALGCGSDDGGKNDAAPKLDTQPQGAEVQADAPQGAEAGPEAQPDNKPLIDQTVDKTTPDQAIDQNPADVPTPIDGPGLDGGLDGSPLDTQPGETAKPIDSGVDTGSVG
jgi:hypothetical protein